MAKANDGREKAFNVGILLENGEIFVLDAKDRTDSFSWDIDEVLLDH